ncbi:hypothetical protein QJS10_CPA09g00575 [Acorus calamus]|uniref:DUF4283 domain-containing protein n=1 Tax=Acorus calamus TaxID=4465 RepID=A0AAV9E3E3_ACOCL|nr:hypothetical protein QJS10_CPA09g00575 [Acorus calamus]
MVGPVPPGVHPKAGTIDRVLLSLKGGKEVGETSAAGALRQAVRGQGLHPPQAAGRPQRGPDTGYRAQNGKGPQRGSRHTQPSLRAVLAPQPKTWAQLLPPTSSSTRSTALEKIDPGVEDGQVTISCLPEDTFEIENHWKLSLLGYVIGKRPYYKPFVDFLHRTWKPKGSLEILMREGGFFIAKFSQEEDLRTVIEGGPWLMSGRPIVLRQWTKDIRMEIERLESIPIWVRFPSLPLHMWGQRMLSKLASAIGTPLYSDMATAERSRIIYARVCIEVSAKTILPDFIRVRDGEELRIVQVEYEWKPIPCKACCTFGHTDAQCGASSGHSQETHGKAMPHEVRSSTEWRIVSNGKRAPIQAAPHQNDTSVSPTILNNGFSVLTTQEVNEVGQIEVLSENLVSTTQPASALEEVQEVHQPKVPVTCEEEHEVHQNTSAQGTCHTHENVPPVEVSRAVPLQTGQGEDMNPQGRPSDMASNPKAVEVHLKGQQESDSLTDSTLGPFDDLKNLLTHPQGRNEEGIHILVYSLKKTVDLQVWQRFRSTV